MESVVCFILVFCILYLVIKKLFEREYYIVHTSNYLNKYIRLHRPISRNEEILSIKNTDLSNTNTKDIKYMFQIRKSYDGTIQYYDGEVHTFNGNPNNSSTLDNAFFVYNRENADKILSLLNQWAIGWDYILRIKTTIITFSKYD